MNVVPEAAIETKSRMGPRLRSCRRFVSLVIGLLAIAPIASAATTPVSKAAIRSSPKAAARPVPSRVVLVSIDGARAGLETRQDVMPALARVAAQGARLEWATTPTPLTFPATVALLTGASPTRTRVQDEATEVLDDDVTTLSERFSRAGFSTAGFPSDFLSHRKSGVSQGFDRFEARSWVMPESARVDSALAELRGAGPRFVWLGLTFGENIEPWRRYAGSGLDSTAYLERARLLDSAIGRLVEGLERDGALGSTLIAIVGTRGEGVSGWKLAGTGFDEEPLPGRGLDLSEDGLRVPLVLHGLSVPARAGAIPATWVSVLDVAPTLCEAAGIPPATDMDGRSLWSLLGGTPLPARTLIHQTDVNRTLGWKPQRAVRRGRIKMVAYGEEVVALSMTDPARGPSPSGTAGELKTRLRALVPARPAAKGTDTIRTHAEEIEEYRTTRRIVPRLEAKVDSVELASIVEYSRRHPGNLMFACEIYNYTSRAGGNDDMAAAAFLNLIGHHPEYPEAVLGYADHLFIHKHFNLVPLELLKVPSRTPLAADAAWREVLAFAFQLKFDEAIAAADRAEALGDLPGQTWRNANAKLRRARELKRAIDLAPDRAALHLDYAKALIHFGIVDEANKQLHRVRYLDPANTEPNILMGDILLRQKRYQQAINAYNRALEWERENPSALLGIAEALVEQGKPEGAVAYLRRVVAADPKNASARYNLACVLAVTGDLTAAATELEQAVGMGYARWDLITGDPDLAALRSTETYRRIVQSAPRSGGP